MRIFIYIVSIFILLVSCAKKEAIPTKENVKNISMDIGGMTCEIGCARLIESRLSKVEGVKDVAITFNDSIGEISFDANKISKEDLVNTVERIADGELYSVKKVTETE